MGTGRDRERLDHLLFCVAVPGIPAHDWYFHAPPSSSGPLTTRTRQLPSSTRGPESNAPTTSIKNRYGFANLVAGVQAGITMLSELRLFFSFVPCFGGDGTIALSKKAKTTSNFVTVEPWPSDDPHATSPAIGSPQSADQPWRNPTRRRVAGTASVGHASLFEQKHVILTRLRLMFICARKPIHNDAHIDMREPIQVLVSFFLSYWSRAAETASHMHRARWPTRYLARLRSSAEGRQRTGDVNSRQVAQEGQHIAECKNCVEIGVGSP